MHDILNDLTMDYIPKEIGHNKVSAFNNRLYTDGVIDPVSANPKTITILFHNDSGAVIKAFSDTINKQC